MKLQHLQKLFTEVCNTFLGFSISDVSISTSLKLDSPDSTLTITSSFVLNFFAHSVEETIQDNMKITYSCIFVFNYIPETRLMQF